MNFNEVTRLAAQEASRAVDETMTRYRQGHVRDEDDITGVLVGSLQTTLEHSSIEGVDLTVAILRHRGGVAAEERRYGADMLLHVTVDTSTQEFSKGVLVQAKKSSSSDYWSSRIRSELNDQCNRMLNVTPAAFVFNYSVYGMRCGAASRVVGARGPQSVRYLCGWTPYRFFLEFFRCPIGDPKITSARVEELASIGLDIRVTGQITLDEGASLP
jgi:hypothetical protein